MVRNMEDCISDIRFWMLNNGLKVNDDKTEFLTIGTSQQLEKLHNVSIRVCDSDIHPVPIARNLGSWFDSWLSMATHHKNLCLFIVLYTVSIIFVGSESTFHSSQWSFLWTTADCLLNKLQRVQNACARLIFKVR